MCFLIFFWSGNWQEIAGKEILSINEVVRHVFGSTVHQQCFVLSFMLFFDILSHGHCCIICVYVSKRYSANRKKKKKFELLSSMIEFQNQAAAIMHFFAFFFFFVSVICADSFIKLSLYYHVNELNNKVLRDFVWPNLRCCYALLNVLQERSPKYCCEIRCIFSSYTAMK